METLWKPSSGSRFRSSVERLWILALALAVVEALAGCGGGECGPGDAPADGVSVAAAGETFVYGGFTSSPNNDCTPPEGGPTSLTLEGQLVEPTPQNPLFMTFCLPRPDQLGGGAISLDNSDLVQVIDVFAERSDGCLLIFDRTAAPTGTIDFQGYCDNGLESSGYAIEFDATLRATVMCPDGTMDEPVTLELSGSTAVEALMF